ncbi:MAG: glycosyltransferase [Lachnospiraceae bacterium]|nr:glycosyltransferase [Lachnospiraceae bacterium]
MKVLIYEWASYNHRDIVEAFRDAGCECRIVKHRFEDVNVDDGFAGEFAGYLKDGNYGFVYSTNFFPVIAECCNRNSVKYISWSYDAPLDVPDIERTLGLPCNYAFMYDREQVLGYKNKGFDNVYHLPLAVNVKRLDGMILSAAERKKYSAQVSFVGNLYGSEMLNIRSILDEFHQGYLDALMKAQSKIYGYYVIDELLTDGLLNDINRTVYDKTMEYRREHPGDHGDHAPVLNISREALSYAMAAQITREDRLLALKLLANHYDVKLYSREKNELLDKITYMGTVDYDNEMPKVFKASDINLNMTLRCIRSGIPLRALDIMGAGGFLLSNYQPELAECFIDGEEMIMYESIEDMYAKASYYLNNPEIRTEIAKRGHEKVSREFCYDERIRTMLDTAGPV